MAKTAAERQAEYRKRKGCAMTVYISQEVMDGLMKKVMAHQADRDPECTLSRYVERLISTQVLRVR